MNTERPNDHATIRDKGDFAAALPHLLGFRPDELTVVVVGLQGSRVGPIAVLHPPSPQAFAPDAVDGLARDIGPAFESHGVTTSIVVGYGPDGPDRVHRVAGALGHQIAADHNVSRWCVDRGLVRTWDDARGWGLGEAIGGGEEWVLRGSSPADSYDRLRAAFQQQPDPTWPELSATQARELDALPVADQVALARTLVSRMTEPGSQGQQEFGWLGALASHNRMARDAVLGAAVSTEGGLGVLQAALPGAPAAYRDSLTAVTAATLYASGRSSQLTEELAERIDPAGPNAGLAALIRGSVMSRLDPAVMRDAIVEAGRDTDALLHRAERPEGPRPAGAPGGSREAPMSRGRAAELRIPHKPGGAARPDRGIGR